jgi:hypothetical protein
MIIYAITRLLAGYLVDSIFSLLSLERLLVKIKVDMN